MKHQTNDTKLSFDEFKLYYESTEKVTDRRLSANTWNYSICVGILVSIAAIVKWSTGSPSFFYAGLTAVFLLSIMAIPFCSLWLGQISDFKYLNNAKFQVLNEMAPRIEFDIDHPEQITSFCPFEKEWSQIEQVKAAVEIRQRKIIALKSSNIEYFIPSAFRVLFFLIGVAVLIGVILNFALFVNSWKAILRLQ
jgi:hypothetical protein